MSACPVCEVRAATLGEPSEARWRGPDGGDYCSMHFIQKFGHGEPLIRLEDFEPPAVRRKPPAPRDGRRKKAKADQVEA